MPRHELTRSLNLQLRASAMRSQPTHSELLLARCLAGSRLGVAFRRQVPLAGRFIVDFLAPKCKLVVEVDGAYHATRAEADARRDRALERLGYRVLRISDELVEKDLATAVELVREAVATARG